MGVDGLEIGMRGVAWWGRWVEGLDGGVGYRAEGSVEGGVWM